ncbi:MAG: AraC family transcriptional regulator [Eubacteriales bacterium]
MFVGIAKDSPGEFPFVPVAIGESPRQARVVRSDGFDVHQFLWVTRGEGLFSAAGQTRVLGQGQGLFTRKFVPHAYQSNGGEFDTMWVTFVSGEALLDYYQVGEHLFFEASDFLADATLQLMELCRRTDSLAVRAAHGYSWAAELLDSLFARSPGRAQQVTLFLEHHCDRPLTLDEIAAHVGTDRFSLCRWYAKETGETVMSSLRRIRMQKAKKLLRYSSYSVEQIGRMCGYDSPSYFSKTFREQTKRTPRQYRQRGASRAARP